MKSPFAAFDGMAEAMPWYEARRSPHDLRIPARKNLGRRGRAGHWSLV